MITNNLTSPTVQIPSSPQVRDALLPFVERGELAGAVALVANSAGVLSIDTVGYSDIEAQRPMAQDSFFWIASQTKPFVSTAVMMLADRGLLNPDDEARRFISELDEQWVIAEQDEQQLVLKKPARPITITDLLTHTSGMVFRSLVERPTLDGLLLQDSVMSYVLSPLISEPGTRYNYSNAGINTAARIVEIVSGRPFAQFLQTELLTPLGMRDTTFWPNKDQLSRLAKTYRPSESTGSLVETTTAFLQYPLDNPQRKAMPAGGLFSTASDMARFCRMYLCGGKLDGKTYLSKESLETILRPRRIEPQAPVTGLGWYIEVDGSAHHGGALSTFMTVNPELDRALVYLVQHEGFPGNGADALGAFKAAALGFTPS